MILLCENVYIDLLSEKYTQFSHNKIFKGRYPIKINLV